MSDPVAICVERIGGGERIAACQRAAWPPGLVTVMSTEPAACAPVENWIVVLSRTVPNTATFAMVTVAPGSNCEPVIVPHVPAVVTTFGETPAIVGRRPVGGGAGPTTEGGSGEDTGGAGSDDGTDGEAGDPPQAAVVNTTISSIPILVSFKFAARFLINTIT